MFSRRITITRAPLWATVYPAHSLPPEERLPSLQGCRKAHFHCPSSQCFICVTLNPNLIKQLQRAGKSQCTRASGRRAPFTCVTARRVSLQKAPAPTASPDSYRQATLCISEFHKDHTAANALARPKDQINAWLPSSHPCHGIITDNRARAAKAMRWQIYTCAMLLYIVYICCYKTLSRALVSIFWMQNVTYFRAFRKLYDVTSD